MDQQPLPAKIEDLLDDLQPGLYFPARIIAAEQLAKVDVSSPAIVRALMATRTSDISGEVRKLAATALDAPVHQEIIQKFPDLEAEYANIQNNPPIQAAKPAPASIPPKTTPQPQSQSDSARSTSRSTQTYHAPYYDTGRYKALRGIASLCYLLSWIVAGIAGISILVSFIKLVSRGGFYLGFGGIAISLLLGGITFLFLRVMGESISVLLDIEANTRKAAGILEQRLR